MKAWNTLPESYQQRLYKNTPATGKRQIQQAENPTPALVISVEAARVDNVILLDYLTSDVALEEPGIGSTEPNFPTDVTGVLSRVSIKHSLTLNTAAEQTSFSFLVLS